MVMSRTRHGQPDEWSSSQRALSLLRVRKSVLASRDQPSAQACPVVLNRIVVWPLSASTRCILQPLFSPFPLTNRDLPSGDHTGKERYRYIRWSYPHPGEELYDRQTDPGEYENLARLTAAHAPADEDARILYAGWLAGRPRERMNVTYGAARYSSRRECRAFARRASADEVCADLLTTQASQG